jgi:REP element-mobilizing transposase RayT
MNKHITKTLRYSRGKLPHWEVEEGRYFVTVRCADSLPGEVVLRLSEIQRSISETESRSAGFLSLQRQYFRTMEKYLDAGAGACPLRDANAAGLVVQEFNELEKTGVHVPHYTVMPNHWHALIVPGSDDWIGLSAMMKRIKGRTARAIRTIVGGKGPIWQREWFDRWMRNDEEWKRCVSYVRNNPVKAGLASDWREHPWSR